jgi:hypothetical protein
MEHLELVVRALQVVVLTLRVGDLLRRRRTTKHSDE